MNTFLNYTRWNIVFSCGFMQFDFSQLTLFVCDTKFIWLNKKKKKFD